MSDALRNGATYEDAALRETEAQIARTRQRLASSVGALRQEITGLADWRAWVRKQPLIFVGAAFGLGLLLGSRGRD